MGFVTRWIGRRIRKTLDEIAQTPEGKAVLERRKHTMALAQIALEVAGSGLDDTAASAELRARLPEHPRAAGDAIRHLSELRTSHLDDRAYRLLTREKRGGLSFGSSEPRLFGASAQSPDPLLNTDLASSVIQTYLRVKGSGHDYDPDETPFVERKQRTRVGSFALFGRGDTQPRARN
jgi:hypothetical protein